MIRRIGDFLWKAMLRARNEAIDLAEKELADFAEIWRKAGVYDKAATAEYLRDAIRQLKDKTDG